MRGSAVYKHLASLWVENELSAIAAKAEYPDCAEGKLANGLIRRGLRKEHTSRQTPCLGKRILENRREFGRIKSGGDLHAIQAGQ
jgi:hypothetical protein